MMSIAGCWKPQPAALAIATNLLSGCAKVASDHAVCPTVVDYPAAFQHRVVAEVEALSPGSALETMLADYHVMRRQAAVCR